MYVHIILYIYTHMHTHTHTHTHTYIYIYVYIDRGHPGLTWYIWYIHEYVNAYTQTHTHTNIDIPTAPCPFLSSKQVYEKNWTKTGHIHIHTHMPTNIHAQTYPPLPVPFSPPNRSTRKTGPRASTTGPSTLSRATRRTSRASRWCWSSRWKHIHIYIQSYMYTSLFGCSFMYIRICMYATRRTSRASRWCWSSRWGTHMYIIRTYMYISEFIC